MITNAMLFEHELNKLVQERIGSLKDNLAFNAFEEMGQFKFVMGQIAGLVELKELIDEAKSKVDKR